MAPRKTSSADSTAGSTNVCDFEKSSHKSKKCLAPWLKLFTRLPKVQIPHPLCTPLWKLKKMVGDHRRKHLFIWKFGRVFDCVKKQRIGQHRIAPEADGEANADRNNAGNSIGPTPPGEPHADGSNAGNRIAPDSPRELEKCEGSRGFGYTISNPIVLDDMPDENELFDGCEGRSWGSAIDYPIIVDEHGVGSGSINDPIVIDDDERDESQPDSDRDYDWDFDWDYSELDSDSDSDRSSYFSMDGESDVPESGLSVDDAVEGDFLTPCQCQCQCIRV